MWSFGCTIAELFTPNNTIFSDGAEDGGLSSDLVLLASIVSTLGTPTSETWPESRHDICRKLTVAKTFRDWDKIQLHMKPALPRETIVPWAPSELIPWIFSMIVISAGGRSSAAKVCTNRTQLIIGLRRRRAITLA